MEWQSLKCFNEIGAAAVLPLDAALMTFGDIADM
jgi:hypothetical protein